MSIDVEMKAGALFNAIDNICKCLLLDLLMLHCHSLITLS